MMNAVAGRRSLRLVAFLLLALLPLRVPPADAQEPTPAGRVISSIEVRGLQSFTEETIRYYLGIEPGQILDEAALNASLKDLWRRNLVDDIKVEVEPAGEAVKLIITIRERPVLRSIDYQGLKRISKTDILDKLTTQRVRVREGEPLSLGELHRVKALIEEMYSEKGYRFAQARFTVGDAGDVGGAGDVGPNEKTVVFHVDEGDRVRIGDIRFEGNEVFSDLRLHLAMKNVKESGLLTRALKKDLYDPAKLQEDLDKVRDVYRASGYKNAVVGEPRIEVRDRKPAAPESKDRKRRMLILVPIEEGERWRLGEVSIEGNEKHSDQALLRAFAIPPDSWLRAKGVDDGVKAVTDLYHNGGYMYANVEPELVEKEGNVADLIVHVREGEPFKVGRIEFEGNSRTMDRVLRREMRLFEGGVVNVGAVRNSVTKVRQLGYFTLNEEDPVEIKPDVERKVVDLLFRGKEADRTEVQLGGGWSELDGFFGQFSVGTKNFLGRGEQASASYQKGNYRDLVDLSYTIPWFLDRPQFLGIRAFDQYIDYGYDSYDQQQIRDARGATLTYGRNLRLFQSASLSYNLSKYDDETIYVVPETAEGETPPGPDEPQPGDTITAHSIINSSSLRPQFGFDSRDNPLEPTRGQSFSLGVEYAGGVLGGENYFVRPQLSYNAFVPVGSYPVRSLFAVNLEGGMIHPFDETKYPLSPLERFFLGGESSIRGHSARSLYLRKPDGEPRTDADGVILGGDSFAQVNLEYHFLLGGPVRLILFGDAGNVFGDGQSASLSNLRYTAGAELRVLIPMFGAPLRFIYALNLNEKPNDDFEAFQFSIGTSF